MIIYLRIRAMSRLKGHRMIFLDKNYKSFCICGSNRVICMSQGKRNKCKMGAINYRYIWKNVHLTGWSRHKTTFYIININSFNTLPSHIFQYQLGHTTIPIISAINEVATRCEPNIILQKSIFIVPPGICKVQ